MNDLNKEQMETIKELTKDFTKENLDKFEKALIEEDKKKQGTILYDKLLKDKENGIKLDFDKISKEDLEQLWRYEYMSDTIIANLFDITKSKVTYKRRKFGITCGFNYMVKILSSL